MPAYKSPKGHMCVVARETAYRWFLLPYGAYICSDGRKILFNREYCPIWERKDDIVKKSNMKEWVVDIVDYEHYYKDGTRNKKQIGINKLIEWGIEIPPTSELKQFKLQRGE